MANKKMQKAAVAYEAIWSEGRISAGNATGWLPRPFTEREFYTLLDRVKAKTGFAHVMIKSIIWLDEEREEEGK